MESALLPVPSSRPTMRAILQSAYGQPEVLTVGSVERPAVGEDGVLVRVIAVGVHKGDWHLLTGKPYILRAAGFGLMRPNQKIPGMAVAGRVEAVGEKVKDFRVGDEVFGEISGGGFAEYVCVREAELAPKPAAISFEDAATLPISATTALQALRDAGGVLPGQSVLINGASGGVGTFAVQLAKALGAVVTGVCSTGNVELVRSLGADHVIDYTKADFTAGTARYDVILDLIGNQPLAAARRVLTERGRLVAASGGADHEWVGPMFSVLLGIASNLVSRQPFAPLAAKPNREDLIKVAAYVEAGAVKPVISKRYSLAEVPEALRCLGLGHTRGKSVITISPPTE